MGAVLEHGGVRVPGQFSGHERELHHGLQIKAEKRVQGSVHSREIEPRAASRPGENLEVVMEYAMRSHPPGPQLVVGYSQRVPELGPHVVAERVLAHVELAEPLRTDHGPHPLQCAGAPRRVHVDVDYLWVARERAYHHGAGGRHVGLLIRSRD